MGGVAHVALADLSRIERALHVRGELAAMAETERLLAENRELAQRFAATVDRKIAAMREEAKAAVAGTKKRRRTPKPHFALFGLI